jgi:glutathione peroxidase
MQQTFVSLVVIIASSFVASIPVAAVVASEKDAGSIYDFTMKTIDGKDTPLSNFKGKVVLIVNVASECGFTPQYKGLEALYRKYKDQGFTILGFPANNFGQQEPGTDAEIKTFCTTTYDVTFDLFSKISVKGNDQHPLYRFLTSAKTDPKFSGDVKWNFQKYLIDRNGNIVGKFASSVEPLSNELTSALEQTLKAK